MRSNLALALLCLLLGAALADWLSARDAHAQALPPSSGGTSYTHPSAISLANGIDSQDGGTFTGNVSTNGKFSSSAASGADGFMFDTVGARLRLGGSSNALQAYASGTNQVIIGDASSTTLFAYAIQANSSIAASNGNGVLERTSNSMQLRTTIGDPGVPAWIINTNSAFTSDILTLKNNGTSIATFTAAGALKVNVGGGGSKPTCDSSMRNAVWFVQGGAGVKDTYEVCAKDAADAYAWRTIY